jgi:hypothetical protein
MKIGEYCNHNLNDEVIEGIVIATYGKLPTWLVNLVYTKDHTLFEWIETVMEDCEEDENGEIQFTGPIHRDIPGCTVAKNVVIPELDKKIERIEKLKSIYI